MNPLLTTLLEVQHLYAVQSHAIDGGDAEGWADTFVPDGAFVSPTYDAPVRGRDALTAFARDLHTAAPHLHHLITNVAVRPADAPGEYRVRANLLIVTTHDLAGGAARIDRITTIDDRLRRTPGHPEELRLVSRHVTRDGAAPDTTAPQQKEHHP
ncbi:nuclear transport factor 2 family protein [Streptomyces sp. NPDC059783]|uniref:nuclear transport factor 2 family protein n=1 Tax=Streptomyces sp. NPDC059783 TaxID=3346944 RepID=UPI0036632B57